jgi:hypothetical protein
MLELAGSVDDAIHYHLEQISAHGTRKGAIMEV